MIKDKKLEYITSVDELDFYRYKARLFNYFYTPMAYYEKLFSRMVRETIDFVRGNYNVVYMAKGEELVGYGVVTRGGGRNKFCTKNDIVLCSLWVQPEFRGNGYGNKLVYVLSSKLGITYENAYEYIPNNNTPSIKVAERNGFVKVGNAHRKSKGLKSISMDEKGHLGIYIKNKEGRTNE